MHGRSIQRTIYDVYPEIVDKALEKLGSKVNVRELLCKLLNEENFDYFSVKRRFLEEVSKRVNFDEMLLEKIFEKSLVSALSEYVDAEGDVLSLLSDLGLISRYVQEKTYAIAKLVAKYSSLPGYSVEELARLAFREVYPVNPRWRISRVLKESEKYLAFMKKKVEDIVGLVVKELEAWKDLGLEFLTCEEALGCLQDMELPLFEVKSRVFDTEGIRIVLDYSGVCGLSSAGDAIAYMAKLGNDGVKYALVNSWEVKVSKHGVLNGSGFSFDMELADIALRNFRRPLVYFPEKAAPLIIVDKLAGLSFFLAPRAF